MTSPLSNPAGQPVSPQIPCKGKAPRRLRSSIARVNNMRMIIDALKCGELVRDDIGGMLGFSPSGVRKYLSDLRDSGIVVVDRLIEATKHCPGIPVYHLTDDADLVERFLADLDANTVRPKRATKNLIKVLRDTSRHIHIMNDDEGHNPRIEKVTPARRDEMVAMFFGPVPAAIITESPPCAHFAKPAPRAVSFPVPDRSRFVWEAQP